MENKNSEGNDVKDFYLKWLYTQTTTPEYSRLFVDGMKFSIDGKEEDRNHTTNYKALKGSVWKAVKGGISAFDLAGNTGEELLEHGGFANRKHTIMKTYDSTGAWHTSEVSSSMHSSM
jgi:hypothetical protein